MIKDGNFDGVAHAASPVLRPNATADGIPTARYEEFTADEGLTDYLRPAIEGTTGILESIKLNG